MTRRREGLKTGLLTAACLMFFLAEPIGAQDINSTQATTILGSGNPSDAIFPAQISITFTPTAAHVRELEARGATPGVAQTTFGCTIGYPYVTSNTTGGQASWQASVSCTAPAQLYGTTAFYQWGTSNALAYGNQINVTSTAATSSGQTSGRPHGQYGVNFNIQITPLAGYSTSAGTNCSLVNNNTAVLCHTTTGPFSL